MSERLKRLSVLYVVLPAGALIIVWPMIRELPPISWPDNLNTLQFVAAAPFWIGIAAAPGYLYAWSGHRSRSSLQPIRRYWVALSLAAALLASVTGAVVSALAVVPVPFTIGSAVCSLLLIRRLRQGN